MNVAEIPEELHVAGRTLLAISIDLLDNVGNVLERLRELETMSSTLCAGRAEGEDSLAFLWDDFTGVGPAGTVLVAIGDLIRSETGSTGSYLHGRSAAELREMFADRLAGEVDHQRET